MFQPGPVATPGQRIGLLGGSFNPPHEGHVHITRWALRTLGLDAVWWLVSPGNPLKKQGPEPVERRIAASRRLARHPRVTVTGVEVFMGTRYTADTLATLSRRYPGVRFVWLMGSDNLASFHRWERWEWIMEHYPVAVLARPGRQVLASLSPAGRRFARWRLPQHAASLVTRGEAPRWTLLVGPMSDVSSTEIRERGDWP